MISLHTFFDKSLLIRSKLQAVCLFTLLSIGSIETKANGNPDSTKLYFHLAFTELKNMLEGKQAVDFERAVFVSENPYHNNLYSFADFQQSMNAHLFFITRLAAANNHSDTMDFSVKVNANGRFNFNDVRYTPQEKKELYNKVINNWAIFTYMNDTTGFYPFYHSPFSYSTADPFGMKDWKHSQVINLLSVEQQGNCFALTAFFKIMANRLQTDARICTAPQHIYIQHQDHKGDYYNVELATAGHPCDGTIQTLTYTTSTAIQNGIALRSYDEKQSIGLCLVNLAKAYEHRFNTNDDEFILQCAELALQHDSLSLNALLLKQQVLEERVLTYIRENKTCALSNLMENKSVSKTFYELENHLARLNHLGYIPMPMDMQQVVLNGFKNKNTTSLTDKNPKPFTTIKPQDAEDESYWTVSDGLFQEVFEPNKLENYGAFVFDTETKHIGAIDTTKTHEFLIDPVAFAYDFGARIYDSRLGRWLSLDPLGAMHADVNPYNFVNNSPLSFIDPDGRDWTISITKEGGNTHVKIILDVAIMNSSGSTTIVMADLETAIKTQVEASYSFSEVQTNMINHTNGGPEDVSAIGLFTVETEVNIRTITAASQLKDDEHLIEVLKSTDPKVAGLYGRADQIGGKKVYLNASYVAGIISGADNNTVPHELGHTLGLLHVDDIGTKETDEGWFSFDIKQYMDAKEQSNNPNNVMFSGGSSYMKDATSIDVTRKQIDVAVEEYKDGDLNKD